MFPIKILQLLAPPGEADFTKPGLTAGRDDVGKCEVQVPECGKCRPQLQRQLLDGDPPVVIELALSDT
jgi:hypothetical protein